MRSIEDNVVNSHRGAGGRSYGHHHNASGLVLTAVIPTPRGAADITATGDVARSTRQQNFSVAQQFGKSSDLSPAVHAASSS